MILISPVLSSVKFLNIVRKQLIARKKSVNSETVPPTVRKIYSNINSKQRKRKSGSDRWGWFSRLLNLLVFGMLSLINRTKTDRWTIIVWFDIFKNQFQNPISDIGYAWNFDATKLIFDLDSLITFWVNKVGMKKWIKTNIHLLASSFEYIDDSGPCWSKILPKFCSSLKTFTI